VNNASPAETVDSLIPHSRTPARFFSNPLRPTSSVARENGINGAGGLLLSTLPGRLAWAAYLRKRVPARVLRARIAEHRSEGRISRIVVSNQRDHYRAGVLVGVGPGEQAGLLDLISSIRHYESDDIKIVVADDLTGQYPDGLLASEFPGIDFVRPLIAAGSGICPFRTLEPALIHLVQRYGLPAVLKCDPDTLVIGSGAFDQAVERFRSTPRLGIVGRTVFDTSYPVDARWARWMAHPEHRWSPRFRRLVRAAASNASRLDFAQGGACFLSGPAVRTAIDHGLLPYHQPQWSLQGQDVLIGLIIQAAGYAVEPFGEPSPIATDTDHLLLEPLELIQRGAKIVHSVRSSPSGMAEDSIRTLFRTAREGAQG
jgi:hypothetical protein